MTHLETKLWDKIKEFKFDDPGTQLTFAARLQRENGWTQPYTLRVIDEYKKFIFFCCTSTSPVTPSDPVDQAWHLHLTYTKSYWNNLCRDTIGRAIHHNPTKGGKREQEKFSTLYKGSRDIYVEYFGCHPPSDIWHDNTTRFRDVNFQRVNISRNWIVKKPFISNANLLKQLVATTFAFLCIQAAGEGFVGVFILVITIIALNNLSKKDKDRNNRGNCNSGDSCSSYSCAGDSSAHSHSGCSSHGSDSGCSSGCSGCGGGCGGD